MGSMTCSICERFNKRYRQCEVFAQIVKRKNLVIFSHSRIQNLKMNQITNPNNLLKTVNHQSLQPNPKQRVQVEVLGTVNRQLFPQNLKMSFHFQKKREQGAKYEAPTKKKGN